MRPLTITVEVTFEELTGYNIETIYRTREVPIVVDIMDTKE